MKPRDDSAENSRQGRQFEKLVIWVSTFSIAALAGFLASIKQINPAVSFQFSALSVIAFFVGGTLTFVFVHSVLSPNKKHRALLVLIVAVAALLGYFAFGIKNVSSENRMDVTVGTAIAVAVLAFLGWVLWRVSRFFEGDQQGNGDDSK